MALFSTHQLGEITLDISTIVYFITYIPQLWHNRNIQNLSHLSLNFHVLLFICYITDLIYALKMNMPTQYLAVSLIGFFCLIFQHVQLLRFYKLSDNTFKHFKKTHWLIITILILGLFFTVFKFKPEIYISLEYISQICAWLYVFPQLIKNWQLQDAVGLSFTYLILGLVTTLCDTITSWALDFHNPNKIGAFVRIIIHLLLISQWVYYHYKNKKSSQKIFE